MNIAIIGCGASALFFAATCKKYNITIFERNKKIASKLLASGNGRCNILNINAKPENYNNPKFMEDVFNNVSSSYLYKTFNKLGLTLKQDDEGRVYPFSESSANVLDILLDNINAKIISDYKVERINKVNNKYQINDYNTLFDYVILASGSSASINPDKSDICYSYYESLNLKHSPLKPSLVGFKAINMKRISGVRCKANVRLYNDSKLIYKENGEVNFKDDGISGIVVMNMSSYYNRINKLNNPYLILDLLPGVNPSNYKGALNPILYDYIISNNIDPHNFKIDIISTYDMSKAQVASGGIDLNEINSNFSLKKDNNIYLMGEMLNIDGVCGGYNLTFAFASAEIVRRSIENENSN